MKSIFWLLAGLFLFGSTPLAGQSGSGSGFWYGISAGGGYLTASCDSCEDSGQWGGAWGFHGGGMLSSTTAVGVEVSGFYTLDGGGYPWLGALGAVLRWSPGMGDGIFLKGGLGWGWYKGLVPVGVEPPRASGFQAEVGGGWDFSAGGGVTVSPFADFMVIPSTELEDPANSTTTTATGYLLQFGISVSHF